MMSHTPIPELSDEELLESAAKIKTSKTWDALIFGFLIGIAIFASVNKGFGLLTFIPLLYLPIAGKNQKYYQALEEGLKERGLS